MITPLLDGANMMEVEESAGEMFPGASALFNTVLEDYAESVEWYRRYFVEHDHAHYLGDGEELGGVVIVSVLMSSVPKLGVQHRVIVWAVSGVTRHVLESPHPLPFDAILRAVLPDAVAHRKLFGRLSPAQMEDPEVQTTLLKLENDEPSLRIKIGVLFASHGQVDETAMYQNQHGSNSFETFLDLLGDRVRLQGFDGYAAQLDPRHDGSGTHSVYRKDYAGYEIMFHVSTLLQYDPTDEQRIQRKRFIGNDIIMIVFMDGDTTYNIECMASQYTRVVLVVRPVLHPDYGPGYALSVGSMKGLRSFGPPVYATYPRTEAFIEVLLAKCINGEKATMASPEFLIRDKRTRKGYLQLFRDTFGDPKALRKKVQKKDNDLNLIPVLVEELAADTKEKTQAFSLELAMDAFPHVISSVVASDEHLFFGTPNGLYHSVAGSLQCSKVINIPDVLQIVSLVHLNAIFLRTPKLLISLPLDDVIASSNTDQPPKITVVPTRAPILLDVATIGDHVYLAAVARLPSAKLDVYFVDAQDSITHIKSVSLRQPPHSLTLVPILSGAVLGFQTDFELVPFTNFFVLPLDSRESASATIGAFPLPDTNLTLLAYDDIGVVLSAEDLSLVRGHVFRWIAPPVHVFVASADILVVVYHTSSEVYSLRNGSCIETHLVTAPTEYECRGSELYLPSWIPASETCSLFHLVPKPSPFHATGPSLKLNASMSAVDLLSNTNTSDTNSEEGDGTLDSPRSIASRRSKLSSPIGGAPLRVKRARSSSVFDSASMFGGRSPTQLGSSPNSPRFIDNELSKSFSDQALMGPVSSSLDSKKGSPLPPPSTPAPTKKEEKKDAKAAKKEAKAAAKVAKAEAKKEKKAAKAAAKAKGKDKGKGKAKGKGKDGSTSSLSEAIEEEDRARARTASGVLIHRKAAPPSRARSSSNRRSSLRDRRRQLRQARESGRRGSSVGERASGGKDKVDGDGGAGPSSSSARHVLVDENAGHEIDVDDLAAKWDKFGVIM